MEPRRGTRISRLSRYYIDYDCNRLEDGNSKPWNVALPSVREDRLEEANWPLLKKGNGPRPSGRYPKAVESRGLTILTAWKATDDHGKVVVSMDRCDGGTIDLFLNTLIDMSPGLPKDMGKSLSVDIPSKQRSGSLADLVTLNKHSSHQPKCLWQLGESLIDGIKPKMITCLPGLYQRELMMGIPGCLTAHVDSGHKAELG